MSSLNSRAAPRLMVQPTAESTLLFGEQSVARQEAAEAKYITPALEDVRRKPRHYTSGFYGAVQPREQAMVRPKWPSDVRVFGKTAVLGGSFDPPHWGTAWCVRRLLAAGARDVWLMPVAQHAEKKNQSPFSVRMLMAFALADHLCGEEGIPREQLVVTNVEGFVDSGGQTLEVLRAMRRLYSPRSFVLAVGADVGESMLTWPTHQALVQEFPVVVLERPGGYRGAQLLAMADPAIEISSTQIRAACTAGASVETLAPEKVLAVMRKHKLYGSHHDLLLFRQNGAAMLFGSLSLLATIGLCFHWLQKS